jgi:serine/threonine protein kinase
MGVVYKAKDLKLGRYIALKFLSDRLLADKQAARRFAKEARTASRLNHPNICTVYEISEHDGKPFIAMELIEGDTLKERIQRDRFSAGSAVDVALQITDALTQAHAKGVIHRDLKPANIFVDHNGQVKVLDFGLAKLVPAAEPLTAASSATTVTGVILGTPHYMSPEQALGRKLDARSDLFSLGVVLYEMVTGEQPFKGSTLAGVFDQILNLEPMPIARFNHELPPALASIISQTLRKDADRRYQTALEMHNELLELQRDLQAGVTAPAISEAAYRHPSIAVMPFVNTGANRRDDYFGEGLAEEIINALVRVPGCRVASRTSAFHFTSRNADLRLIGEKLNVSAVLEGSFRRSRSNMRISVRLVDVVGGYPVWAETFDRNPRDIFAVQEEIAQQIVTSLKVQFEDGSRKLLTRAHSEDVEAYDLYLQGRFYWNKRTTQGLKKSIRCFKAAIEADRNYGLAYSGLADAHIVLRNYIDGKSAALQALRVNEDLAEPHSSLGLIRMYYDRDWKSAEREFKRSIELNPAYATAHHWYALLLEHAGRLNEAVREIKRAHELEPLSLIIASAVARIQLHAGKVHEALTQAESIIELDRGFYVGYIVLGWVFRRKGQFGDALLAARKAYKLSRTTEALADIGIAQALTGQHRKAIRTVGELQRVCRRKGDRAYYAAAIYGAMGESDRAFDCIADHYKDKSAVIWTDLAVDTRFDTLRSDPRFNALVSRII